MSALSLPRRAAAPVERGDGAAGGGTGSSGRRTGRSPARTHTGRRPGLVGSCLPGGYASDRGAGGRSAPPGHDGGERPPWSAPHGPRTFSRGRRALWGRFWATGSRFHPRVWNNITAAGFLTFCSMSCAFVRADARSFLRWRAGSLVHYILEHVMRRAGAEFPRLAPEELARLAGEVADQYVAENMPAAGAALCLPGGTAEARRNAFVGVSSGGAGPKPVPSGRL